MEESARPISPTIVRPFTFQVQRQHEEAVKEVNQAMSVRIKASKDLKRLTEERNAAMQVGTTTLKKRRCASNATRDLLQEYSLIMSERDSVHKEIEKLQEEVAETRRKAATVEGKNREKDEEVRGFQRSPVPTTLHNMLTLVLAAAQSRKLID